MSKLLTPNYSVVGLPDDERKAIMDAAKVGEVVDFGEGYGVKKKPDGTWFTVEVPFTPTPVQDYLATEPEQPPAKTEPKPKTKRVTMAQLMARIEAIEARNQALEATNDALEDENEALKAQHVAPPTPTHAVSGNDLFTITTDRNWQLVDFATGKPSGLILAGLNIMASGSDAALEKAAKSKVKDAVANVKRAIKILSGGKDEYEACPGGGRFHGTNSRKSLQGKWSFHSKRYDVAGILTKLGAVQVKKS